MSRVALALTVLVAAHTPIRAQSQTPALVGAQFDVVSIKPNQSGSAANGMRTLPDGSQVMTNISIRQIIGPASPVPVSEVDGLPDWAMTERYDIITKSGFRPTGEQRSQMLRHMLIERFTAYGSA